MGGLSCSTSIATIIAATDQARRRPSHSGAPDINIGTFSMDRERWAHVVEPFMETLRAFEFLRAQRRRARERRFRREGRTDTLHS